MNDILNFLIQFITVDIFIGFGLYTFLYVLITTFKRGIRLLETLDLSSARFIIAAGIIYFSSIVIWTILSIITAMDSDTERGQYGWWVPWVQPLIWTLLTQLFWIKKIREIRFLRLIIAILFIVSFERFVIIVTTLHRDYLPMTWTMFGGLTPSEIILGLTIKVILFCLLATLYGFMVDRVKLFAR